MIRFRNYLPIVAAALVGVRHPGGADGNRLTPPTR